MAHKRSDAQPTSPDPGKLEYRRHNIYLNFIDSYSRLPAEKPITLGQKTLFTFWVSCVVLLVLRTCYKRLKKLMKEEKREDPDGNLQDYTRLKTSDPAGRSRFIGKTIGLKELNRSEISLTNIVVNARACDVQNVEQKLDKAFRYRLDNNEPLSETMEEIPDSFSFRKIPDYCTEIYYSVDEEQPAFDKFLARACLFGAIMFYFWLSDFVHMWPNVDKMYSRDMFIFLFFLLVFVAVIFSIRQTKDKLLNRDQTEEWKGWMQVQFVWYHYFDAQETYNSIRCYVGAYVWMTGFGNYIYFSTRKDYSLYRLMKMLFRLNFLVFSVMIVTNHQFVRYYICAMHTYWFLSVWVVMVVLNRYNDNPKFIILKFCVYFVVNGLIYNIPGAVHKLFHPLKFFLKDHNGKLDYWQYRSWLDHWSTLVGMIVAYNFANFEQILKYLDKDEPETKKKREVVRYGITAALLAVFAVWFNFVLTQEKHHYLKLHPYTSPIPIVIYTWLRNMHPVLRTHYLNVFTWLGKITLETYLSQIHIYMMGDAKKILVYLPRYPMLNFTLSTLIYIAVSYVLFKLTVFFSAFVLPKNQKVLFKMLLVGGVWMFACYAVSFLTTHTDLWRSDGSVFEQLRWNITKY